MIKRLAIVVSLAIAGTSAPVYAQERPAADPADVESVDAIVTALYDVISGAAGVERNWDRMRSLFIDGARLIPTGTRPDNDGNGLRVVTVEDWIEQVGPMLVRDGFFEIETNRVTQQFGHVVHAFSTYDSKRTADDPEPFMRGINSIQLFDDGTRWWLVTVFWKQETPDSPIPREYLGS